VLYYSKAPSNYHAFDIFLFFRSDAFSDDDCRENQPSKKFKSTHQGTSNLDTINVNKPILKQTGNPALSPNEKSPHGLTE